MKEPINYLLWIFEPGEESKTIISNIAIEYEGTVTEVDEGENMFISFPSGFCREIALEDMLDTYTLDWILEDLPSSEMKRYRG
mgnify:CR=1 FL=1